MASSLWKGKGRQNAQDMDPEELNPTMTYRHLLSSGLGVRNPLRVCGLTDMDAFYAACEQKRLGLDPSLPLVVRQWDALIAVNYPARTYGISRMDKISDALKRCPHLRVVHVAVFDPSVPDARPTYTDSPNSLTHKVSLDYYRKESKKIMDVFKEMLPGAEVERASIDEAFIDFTEPVRQQILAHFPHLSSSPPEGLDTPLPPPPVEGVPLTYPPSRSATQEQPGNIWADLGVLIPIAGKPPDKSTPKDKSPETSDNGNNSVRTTILNINEEENGGDALNRDIVLTSTGRSLSAEADVAMLGDEEDEKPLSDEDDFLPHGDGFEHLQALDTSIDEARPPTWHDVALSIAASLMLRMRDEIKTRLGYTTSAGIARNKFLAKLVASYKKRDSQSILRNAAIPNYLKPLPFQKIRFLGGKLGTALAQAYEAQTVGDLLNVSIEDMQRNFGEDSIWVWEILRGIDRSEVKEKSIVTKSMGASKNLQHPITHPSQGGHWLRILGGELAFRLQEAREENPGLWPKTLVLHVRQSYETARSKQTPFPFAREANIDYIYKAAEKLWTELVGTSAEYDKNKNKGWATGMKITNVFLGFTGVETMAVGQRSIDGFFSPGKKPSSKRKAEESSKEGARQGGTKRQRDVSPETDMSSGDVSVSFRCGRCGKEIRRTVDKGDDRDAMLSSMKMEHKDFHFAQDLARESPGDQTSNGKEKKKKSKVAPKGIAKFFTPAGSKKG
ncbi:DNA/RNA polymerase [Ramaria rubella]|nr:DNA/RNA polymerase [Ramaria rubella]